MKTLHVIGLVFFILLSLQACGQQSSSNQAKMENIPTSEAEWKAKLSEEEYYILRQKGTERPYTGKFLMHKEKGFYTCRGCGSKLFSSESSWARNS